MKREAVLLANELLAHHRRAVAAKAPGKQFIHSDYTIPYGQLCRRAGVPHALANISYFLLEVAEWSATNKVPALNALAVNAKSGIPGEGYDGAGGFEITKWPEELERCIRFAGYPTSIA